MPRDRRNNASGHAPRRDLRGTNSGLQLRRELSGLSFAEQLERIRPPRPFHPHSTGRADDAPVQMYTELTQDQLSKLHGIKTAPPKLRISDDSNMAVYPTDALGGQRAYAELTTMQNANGALAGAGSVLELEANDDWQEVPIFDKKGQTRTLVGLNPKNRRNNTSGVPGSSWNNSDLISYDGMELWADCGKSARTLMGTGALLQTDGDNDAKAKYKGDKGDQKETKPGKDPAEMKYEIMVAHFGLKRLDPDGKLVGLRQKLQELQAKLSKAKDKTVKKKLGGQIAAIEGQIATIYMSAYDNLSEKERDEFDKKAGINKYVMPKVGEGYTMSTGGEHHPGNKTWNFHWAAVVMESGNDRMALENYATGDAEEQNNEWLFNIYGPPSKKGQTFHEQHEKTKQHGKTPTTLHVGPK